MSKSTPTLTQSGLLAVLLERQHYKFMQRARRRARFRRMRTASLKALGWRFRVIDQSSAPGLAETISQSLKLPRADTYVS